MVSEQADDGLPENTPRTNCTDAAIREGIREKVSSIGTFTPPRKPDGRDVHFVYVVDDGEEIAVCNSRAESPERQRPGVIR